MLIHAYLLLTVLMSITCTLNQHVSTVLYLNVYFISVLYLTSIYIWSVLYMRGSRKFFGGGGEIWGIFAIILLCKFDKFLFFRGDLDPPPLDPGMLYFTSMYISTVFCTITSSTVFNANYDILYFWLLHTCICTNTMSFCNITGTVMAILVLARLYKLLVIEWSTVINIHESHRSHKDQ